jgi:hypothetical protein
LNAMKTNPGGSLAPNEVMGRDHLIARLWQILERRSLVLTAERRMGKTSVLKKMVAEPQTGVHIFYWDVEALRSPLEFVDAIFQKVRSDLSAKQRFMSRMQDLLKGGVELQGFKLPPQAAPHWKIILRETLAGLTEQEAGLVILCWDELPIMLDNIQKGQGEQVAMEVLDTLRSLRGENANLRMVFTGSLGLHHVIRKLKDQGYANPSTNDMTFEEVGTLEFTDACRLAESLLIGEGVGGLDRIPLAKTISETVDCFPYFIHHVIDALAQGGGQADEAQVNAIVAAGLTDQANKWNLDHYQDRIKNYYATPEQALVRGILDELAAVEVPVSISELCNRLNAQFVGRQNIFGAVSELDREQVLGLLKLLQRDHYLVQQQDGCYRFKFGLIQRYWQLSRGV